MAEFVIRTLNRRRYAVYFPPGYTTDRKWPVILFLHGAGESGSDGMRPTRVGIGPALERHPDRYPAIVVLPQCPAREYWQGGALNEAMDSVERTIEEASVDPAHMYLTGISMGAFGSFLLATLQPRRFAAVVPICGGGQPQVMAPILAKVPLWVFHGADDGVIPAEYSRDMVDAIRAEHPVELRYTEYPGVDHNSWDRAYSEPELPKWLFCHELTSAPA